VFQLLEELIPLASKYGGFWTAASHMAEEVQWPRFWATHVFLAIFLSFYSLISGLISVIGQERFWELFFGIVVRRASRPS
jgi:hypothetical protein